MTRNDHVFFIFTFFLHFNRRTQSNINVKHCLFHKFNQLNRNLSQLPTNTTIDSEVSIIMQFLLASIGYIVGNYMNPGTYRLGYCVLLSVYLKIC